MTAGVFPLSAKVCVVTGATSGIGLETARGLAALGANVIGVGRSAERAREAEAAIRASCGAGSVHVEVADLASQEEIRALARRIRERTGRVDVLVNNAGVFTARRRLSPDGLELQLAVNHLAPFLLSHELMPLLAVPPEARLLTLSSGSHFGATFAETDLGQSGPYNSLRTYGRTKLACVLFTYELARRLGPRSRISTYAVDPGLVNTDMGLKDASALVRIVWLVRRRKGRTPAEGAKTTLCLASDSAASAQTGRYWKDCRAIPSSRQSYDEGSARRLWELSERLTGIGRFALPAFSQG